MIKYIFLFIACVLIYNASPAQEKIPRNKNAVTGQLGGGGFLTLNYERILLQKQNYFLNGSIGAGISAGPALPLTLSFNFGKENDLFEVGAGTALAVFVNPERDSNGKPVPEFKAP